MSGHLAWEQPELPGVDWAAEAAALEEPDEFDVGTPEYRTGFVVLVGFNGDVEVVSARHCLFQPIAHEASLPEIRAAAGEVIHEINIQATSKVTKATFQAAGPNLREDIRAALAQRGINLKR